MHSYKNRIVVFELFVHAILPSVIAKGIDCVGVRADALVRSTLDQAGSRLYSLGVVSFASACGPLRLRELGSDMI